MSGVRSGADKARSAASMARSAARRPGSRAVASGHGGHFRGVRGYRYYGDGGC